MSFASLRIHFSLVSISSFVYSNTLGQFGPSVPIQHLSMSPDILRNDRTSLFFFTYSALASNILADYTYIFSREEVRALANDPELADVPFTFLMPVFGSQLDDVLQQRIKVNESARQVSTLFENAIKISVVFTV